MWVGGYTFVCKIGMTDIVKLDSGQGENCCNLPAFSRFGMRSIVREREAVEDSEYMLDFTLGMV